MVISGAHPTQDQNPVEIVKDYLLNSPDFQCGFGKGVLKKGRGVVVALPDLSAPKAFQAPWVKRNDAVCIELAKLHHRSIDCCVFVEPVEHKNHNDGYRRTWDFYTQVMTACARVAQGGGDPDILRSKYESFSKRYRKPEHFDEFSESGLPMLGKEKLYLSAMNPLYTESPKHLRWAPRSFYAIVRASDVTSAQRKGFAAMREIGSYMYEVMGELYAGYHPYVLEKDIRFAFKPTQSIYIQISTAVKFFGDSFTSTNCHEMTCVVSAFFRREGFEEHGVKVLDLAVTVPDEKIFEVLQDRGFIKKNSALDRQINQIRGSL